MLRTKEEVAKVNKLVAKNEQALKNNKLNK
jgi:hypothetical protein